MKTVSDKNVIKTSDKSDIPSFRYPDADIEGLNKTILPTQSSEYQYVDPESVETTIVTNQIGTPANLSVDSLRSTQKGYYTVIDATISFDAAPGAEHHEFRVSKIVPEAEA